VDNTNGSGDLIARLRPVIRYAQRQHAGQRRTVDGAPFIVHPLEVAAVLQIARASEEAIAAGILHDTLEKTDTTAQELRKRFGTGITAIVEAVSEDEDIRDYRELMAALRRLGAGGSAERVMLLAKGSLFLGRMSQLSDGMSVLLTRDG
jgi:(p)ppGpp synthase/HD superfamily hydrolase